MKFEVAALLAGGAALASAQQSVWGQCGGIGYSGPTTCASGSYCSFGNAYYSQCLPGTAPGGASSTTTSSRTTTRSTTTAAQQTTTRTTTTTRVTTTPATTTPNRTTASPSPTSGGVTKFKYFGTNQAGGEFGDGAIPGQLNKDYTWPSPSSIDYFLSNGFNTFRIGTKMERIAPPSTGGLTGTFNETYMAGFDSIVNYITQKGGYAIVDPHNYGRYQGNIITSTSDFKAFWVRFANRYKNNARVIFDTNNEYHDMDQSLVFGLNQAAIDGIRSTGATQLILIEGNSYTGAWTWVSSGNAASLIALKDPLNNIAYEMHQYLDTDGSGTSPVCVSSTIFAERLQAATNWCQQNNVKCFLGEIGAGTDSTCQAALRGGFKYMQASGVWIGAVWWAAGPWWGTYYQSIEPGSGPANSVIVPLLKEFQ